MDFAELERAGWGDADIARAYDAFFARMTFEAAPVLLHVAGVRRGARVLDVACGPGLVSAAMAERGADVVGLDFSPPMVKLARERFPTLRFEEGNAQKLAFPDGWFDAVICNFGLLHFPEPHTAMRESARVLRQGGHAAWSVWDAGTPFFSIIPDAIAALGLAPKLPPAPDFFAFAAPGAMERALTGVGLAPEPTRRLSWSVRLRSFDAYWTGITGGVRTRAALQALAEDDRARVRTLVREKLAPYARDGEGYEVPVTCTIGCGARR